MRPETGTINFESPSKIGKDRIIKEYGAGSIAGIHSVNFSAVEYLLDRDTESITLNL
jgi:hypothetical protein